MENAPAPPVDLTQYWNDNYRKFLNRPQMGSSWRLRAVCYQSWPLLFNRLMDFFERTLAKSLIQRLDTPLQGKRVLDVGCGAGRWSEFFNRLGAQVVGIDLVPSVLEENQGRFPTLNFSAMRANGLGFKEGSFDFVSAAVVLQHLPPPEKMRALEEIHRVLRPGGGFFLLEAVPIAGHRPGETSWLLQTEEWHEVLASHGFQILYERPLHGYPLAYLYSAFTRVAGRAIKRIKNQKGNGRALRASPSGETNLAQGLRGKRHLLYHFLDQKILTLIACISFPLEFIWLALKWGGDHRMFLVKKRMN